MTSIVFSLHFLQELTAVEHLWDVLW